MTTTPKPPATPAATARTTEATACDVAAPHSGTAGGTKGVVLITYRRPQGGGLPSPVPEMPHRRGARVRRGAVRRPLRRRAEMKASRR
jgi:hypothetical protein